MEIIIDMLSPYDQSNFTDKYVFQEKVRENMHSGTVMKPYWGFKVGDKIYFRESNIIFDK